MYLYFMDAIEVMLIAGWIGMDNIGIAVGI